MLPFLSGETEQHNSTCVKPSLKIESLCAKKITQSIYFDASPSLYLLYCCTISLLCQHFKQIKIILVALKVCQLEKEHNKGMFGCVAASAQLVF